MMFLSPPFAGRVHIRVACFVTGWVVFGKAATAAAILQAVPFDKVTLDDAFWLPRLETQREVLIPIALERTQPAVDYLQAAADVLDGKTLENPPAPHRFNISDLFKVMEGAAYLLKLDRDPELEARMDRIVEIIGESQTPDGYIYPAHIIGNIETEGDGMGDRPYGYVAHSHELYNVGHLYEAAVAYHQATGKRQLLDIAEKSARHVNRVFFEGDPKYNDGRPVNQAPGHQEIELALVKLHEHTGNPLYLEMARRFLEIRGVTYRPDARGTDSAEYAQQHAPVLEQTEPVGHAVRATYQYAGMADVGRLESDPAYGRALEKIWQNIVDTRIHITGGLGAVHGTEGFGPPFELPNEDAYDETCAGVGNVLFSNRMFLALRDGRYLDVAEIALYNNVLAGVNFEGNRFFYVNPLATRGTKSFNHGASGRAEWFYTACCPTNLARLIPQVAGMTYAADASDLYVAYYIGSRTTVKIAGTPVEISQKTQYPFDGKVDLVISPERPAEFAVRLRIPTWTGDRFMPGGLYPFVNDGADPAFEVMVNGEPVAAKVEKGFAVLRRTWKPGDHVSLNLPMPVRFVGCDERVKANIGRVAVTRGPLVYCAEHPDNSGNVLNAYLPTIPASGKIQTSALSIAGRDVVAIRFPAAQLVTPTEGKPSELIMIPYYAWSNRGPGSMQVWLPREAKTVDFTRDLADSPFKRVSASHTHGTDSIEAIADLEAAKASDDASIPRWTSWDHRNEAQWVEAELKEPGRLRSVGVYWYDDSQGVRLPREWNVEVRQSGKWEPLKLYTTDAYQMQRDQLNIVHPASPITIDAVRVHMRPQPGYCVGILELDVQME